MATRAASHVTNDHDEIRRWAEARGGQPACVKGTGGGRDVGMLRIDFPGYSGEESLQHVDWDEWFEKFDERGLALLYQETTAGGAQSNFNKLVSRETAKKAEGGRSRRSGATGQGRRTGSSTRSKSRSRSARTSHRDGRTTSRSQSKSGSSPGKSRSSGSRSKSSSKTGSRSGSTSRSKTSRSSGTRGKTARSSRSSRSRSR